MGMACLAQPKAPRVRLYVTEQVRDFITMRLACQMQKVMIKARENVFSPVCFFFFLIIDHPSCLPANPGSYMIAAGSLPYLGRCGVVVSK